MAGYASSSKVQSGVFEGCTREQMRVVYERYKNELLNKSGSSLMGATVNGQNFQFGPRRDFTLVEWGRLIRHALRQVDPDFIAQSSSIGVRFGCE